MGPLGDIELMQLYWLLGLSCEWKFTRSRFIGAELCLGNGFAAFQSALAWQFGRALLILLWIRVGSIQAHFRESAAAESASQPVSHGLNWAETDDPGITLTCIDLLYIAPCGFRTDLCQEPTEPVCWQATQSMQDNIAVPLPGLLQLTFLWLSQDPHYSCSLHWLSLLIHSKPGKA